MQSYDIVIIGGGHGAAQAILSLKQAKYTGSIALISAEDILPYQRPPLSKAYLKGGMPAERLPIHRQKLYDDMGVALYLGCRAEQVQPQEKQIILSDGICLQYSDLIMATGGEAMPLPVLGAHLEGIHFIRTKFDIDHMQSGWEQAKNIVIVGGGYVGLEIAAVAIDAGKNVILLEAEDRLLKRVTAPEVSQFYKDYHSNKGVDIKLKAKVTSFAGDTSVKTVMIDDGQSFDADLVIVGIGLIPNTQLAEQAGLDINSVGVVVDQSCQTSATHIYAIGDVTWHHNPFYDRWMRLESVQNAADQAKVAVQNILGTKSIYDSQPWFWSDQYDLKLQMVGLSEGYDQIVVRGDASQAKVAYFYLREGAVIAADCINMMAEFMQAKKLIAGRFKVTKEILCDQRPIKEIVVDVMVA